MSDRIAIHAHGIRFEVDPMLVAMIKRIADDSRAPRMIRACQRCATLCQSPNSDLAIPDFRCRCCQKYRTKTGGSRIYAAGEPAHFSIATVPEFLAKTARAA